MADRTKPNKGCMIAFVVIAALISGGLCLYTDAFDGVLGGGDEPAGQETGAPASDDAGTPELFIWTVYEPDVDVPLNDVFSPGGSEAWACGDDGVIIRTDDGGETWEQRPSGTGEDLDTIWFTDGETGFAAGENGAFVRTNDAGKTWLPVELQVPCMTVLHFFDDDVGFVAGKYGAIYRTDDGGESWRMVDPPTEGVIRSVFTVDESAAYIAAEDGLFGTSDRGDTWSKIELDGLTPNDVAVDHEGRVWVVGDDGILVSRDGSTFERVQTDGWTGPFDSLAVNAATDVGGGEGWVFHTDDGGETWQKQDTGGQVQITSLFRDEDGQLWAAFEGPMLDSISARIGVRMQF